MHTAAEMDAPMFGRRLAAVQTALSPWNPIVSAGCIRHQASVDAIGSHFSSSSALGAAGQKTRVVLLGGPQTGGTAAEIAARLNPGGLDIELVDARALFQGEYADSWPDEVIAKFLDSDGGASRGGR
jgi:hypothetical protein